MFYYSKIRISEGFAKFYRDEERIQVIKKVIPCNKSITF